MTKLTDLTKAPDVESQDLIYIVDTSDITDDPAGSSRRVPLSDLSNTVLVKVQQQVITDPGVSGYSFTVPATASRVWIEGAVASSRASESDTVEIAFNGDSATGYHRQNLTASNGSANTVEAANGLILNVAGATSSNTNPQYVSIMVDGLQSGVQAYAFGHYMQERQTDFIFAGHTYTISQNSDLVTTISLVSQNAGSLSGTLTMYVERELDLLALTT